MTLDDGTVLKATSTYKVSGWATVGSKAPGPPIWEVVAEYLRNSGVARIDRLNTPVIKGIEGNPGLSDYPDRV